MVGSSENVFFLTDGDRGHISVTISCLVRLGFTWFSCPCFPCRVSCPTPKPTDHEAHLVSLVPVPSLFQLVVVSRVSATPDEEYLIELHSQSTCFGVYYCVQSGQGSDSTAYSY